ncbi:MAG: cysteine--tRNA ligase [Chlorobi bacterium]|nr:cysteine--tRNA ligase [Chlorobiota bacterium]
MPPVTLYNTRTREKEEFKPLKPPYVGIYVCGPTVYSDPHLGHARAAVVFDVLRRYLTSMGYKVRFVSNITDVGHLEGDADEGEDKIQKRARLEQLEPMEIAQHYTRVYNNAMAKLNVIPPNIQPHATCHIPEQIELVQTILDKGFAYVVNGSVYFDVPKYAQKYEYGVLSGRRLEELESVTRELRGVEEKKHPADFALWKKAPPTHIMKWKSPWSVGFPGWHLECTVMNAKYLGIPFDIHGGGMDLIFPHHECEIMQAVAAWDTEPVRYWMHNNLITIDGQKMSKSLGNFITIEQVFTGEHERLSKAHHPMALRVLILQTHYRSVIDFSDSGLASAEKAYKRLVQALKKLETLEFIGGKTDSSKEDKIIKHINNFYEFMSDDLNTARAIAQLFDLTSIINQLANEGKSVQTVSPEIGEILKRQYSHTLVDILGILPEDEHLDTSRLHAVLQILINLRQEARKHKNFQLADRIRDQLREIGIILRDTPYGTEWELE